MKNEPLLTVASITAGIAALIGLLVSFGVPLTGDQQTAILGVAAVVAPFIVAAVVRPRVTPVDKTVETTTYIPDHRSDDHGRVDGSLIAAIVIAGLLVWLLVQVLELLLTR